MSNQETNVDISKYKKLDEITHTLLRPARYIGSINPVVANTWFFRNGVVTEGSLTSSPAFHKLFDEIISNSADHSRTPEGKNLTEIDVQVQPETGLIIVTDNGGIPVVLHPEYGQYIPEMIFGELRSGSNFDDNEDSLSTGQNGEGASLVNIFSEVFKVQTIHNGKMFEQVFKNHMMERSTPEICDIVSENGTTITYKPDLKILNAHFDEDTLLLLERRCYEIAFTNPHLKVWFNTKLININNFETFVNSFDKSTVDISQDRWNVAVGLSKTGFQHISYVNSTASFDGGTHVDYVSEKIVEAVRSHIEKKTKQQIRPSDIKNNLRLFIDCKINNPRYNSQTKEKLITAPNQFGSQFKISDKQLKALLASPMIESIIEWAKRKKELEDARSIEEQAKAVRKNGFYDIPKYRPATSKQREDCILFLTEGDCLSDETLVQTLSGVKSLKDVHIGDQVLTHANRFMPVVAKSYSVKESLTFKLSDSTTVVCSQEHRLLVYCMTSKNFGYVKARDIDKNTMKLVKNQLITRYNKFMEIIDIENTDHEKYKYKLTLTHIDTGMVVVQECSGTHSYMTYNRVNKTFSMKTASEFDKDNDVIIFGEE